MFRGDKPKADSLALSEAVLSSALKSGSRYVLTTSAASCGVMRVLDFSTESLTRALFSLSIRRVGLRIVTSRGDVGQLLGAML